MEAVDERGIVAASMRHFFDWTFHWLIDHPYQVAFYILAILASIFARDIRIFFSIPPQKFNIWILKSRLTNAKSTLVALDKYRGNPYQLLLFVAHTFSGAAVVFISATILAFLRPSMPDTSRNIYLDLIIFTTLFLPVIIFWFTSRFLQQLENYDTETKKLERHIGELVDRLAAKGIDSNALLKSIEESQRVK